MKSNVNVESISVRLEFLKRDNDNDRSRDSTKEVGPYHLPATCQVLDIAFCWGSHDRCLISRSTYLRYENRLNGMSKDGGLAIPIY